MTHPTMRGDSMLAAGVILRLSLGRYRAERPVGAAFFARWQARHMYQLATER